MAGRPAGTTAVICVLESKEVNGEFRGDHLPDTDKQTLDIVCTHTTSQPGGKLNEVRVDCSSWC